MSLNKPEKKFYEKLRDHKAMPPGPWLHLVRLESSTAPGIPDCSVVSYTYDGAKKEFEFCEFWLELKAQQSSESVVIRPAQFQWLLKRSHIGANCWVANWHPILNRVTLWRFHDELQAEKKGLDKIKITEKPTLTFNSIEEFIGAHPSTFNRTQNK